MLTFSRVLDDEDELLYGDSSAADVSTPDMRESNKKASTPEHTGQQEVLKPTYWLAICRLSGSLEVRLKWRRAK